MHSNQVYAAKKEKKTDIFRFASSVYLITLSISRPFGHEKSNGQPKKEAFISKFSKFE